MLRQIASHIPGAKRAWRAFNRVRAGLVKLPTSCKPNLALRHATELEIRFPELRRFGLPLNGETASAVLAFYNAYLPLIYRPARSVHLRTLLGRLQTECHAVAQAAVREIAKSDLADGMPDRAQMLRDDPAMRVELACQAAELEEHYRAALISQPWPNISRGASLLYYLQNHTHLCAGKDVLHIAPEPEPRAWLPGVARTYHTMDGIPGDVDFVYDITSIGSPDSSFDVVLCHRVLEHVLDDIGAMRELHRVLRPAGLLNLSVPQAAHREVTAEWVVPDESHHGHVRHYGRDLVSRLESAGFAVEVEPWLLARPRGALLARNAYPGCTTLAGRQVKVSTELMLAK